MLAIIRTIWWGYILISLAVGIYVVIAFEKMFRKMYEENNERPTITYYTALTLIGLITGFNWPYELYEWISAKIVERRRLK